MSGNRDRAAEPLARAKAKGYRKGAHKEEDKVRDRHKACAQNQERPKRGARPLRAVR
jgi:hypothetical protein